MDAHSKTGSSKKKRNLTKREALFCRNYVIHYNGTRAARESGYTLNTSRQCAYELLTRPYIQKEVNRLRKEQEKRLELSHEFVLRELMRIAKFDIRQAFNADGSLKDIRSMPEDTARSISGIDVDELYAPKKGGKGREQVGWTKKIRSCDKVRALTALAQHLGLFDRGKDDQREIKVNLVQVIKEVTGEDGKRIDIRTEAAVDTNVKEAADCLDKQGPGHIRIL